MEKTNINVSVKEVANYAVSPTKATLDQAIVFDMDYFTEKTVRMLNDNDTVLALLHFILFYKGNSGQNHIIHFGINEEIKQAKVCGISLSHIASEYNAAIASLIGATPANKDFSKEKEIVDAISQLLAPTSKNISFESSLSLVEKLTGKTFKKTNE